MFWASKNSHRVMETSLHPAKSTVWCAISKHGLSGPIFVEDTITSQRYLQNEAIPVIKGAGYKGIKFFSSRSAYTAKVILDILHDVFGIRVL
jgi:hypothetical protein